MVGSADAKRDWSRVAIAGESDVVLGSSGGREWTVMVVVIVLLLGWRCLLEFTICDGKTVWQKLCEEEQGGVCFDGSVGLCSIGSGRIKMRTGEVKGVR